MVDFKKKVNKTSKKTSFNPIEIYETLDRKSITGPLRPAQIEILKKWYDEKSTDKDIIVKLHTGEGKTLIGLLILYSKINSTNKPALYICPNKYLVLQVCQEAKKFGIPYCVIPDNNDLPNEFLSGKKVLITHAQKLFNGKSIFGINNQGQIIGSIILDDSHACIDAIKNSFTIRINHEKQAYNKLVTLFEDDLRNQGEGSFLDMQTGNYDAILPIPYWAWIDKRNEITKILAEYNKDPEISFVWPLVKDHIEKCQAFVSGNEIEISPHYIPLDKFPTFTKADQRILMSATTQDDSFFIKGLGFSVESVANPLSINNQKWSGEKMILLPSLMSEELDRELIINKFSPESKKTYGVVALVPSFKRANLYSTLGANVSTSENIFEVINSLKKGFYNKTIVIVNRYDGIDLPDESCRILIMDSLPYFNSLNERYEELCRSTSEIINIKIAQKIEQGLGRSVRGEKDYTAILIIGADLVKFIKSVRTARYFSEQTRKQIEIGLEIAEMTKDDLKKSDSITVLRSLILQSLKRDGGWKEFYKEEMGKISNESKNTEIYSLLKLEHDCELANFLGDYEKACDIMQKFIDNDNLDLNEKGWYLQILARYKYGLSKLDSNTLQKSAFKSNLQLLKPKDGISYTKIEYIQETRINRIKEFFSQFSSFEELSLSIDSVLSNLSFGVEAEKFEKALEDIGKMLGFISQRPDKEIRKGPDNLWGGVENQYLLFECKSEMEEDRSEISKHEAGQMNSHCGWFDAEYGDAKVKRILIAPTKKLSYYANFTHEVVVMRKGKLKEFKANIKAFIKDFKEFRINEVTDAKIQRIINAHKLSIGNLIENYSEAYYQNKK